MNRKTSHHRGYVVDIACLRKYPEDEMLERSRRHTRACALEGHCMESGYAVVTESGEKILLEPAATPMIVDAIRSSTIDAGIELQIFRSEHNGEKRTTDVKLVNQS